MSVKSYLAFIEVLDGGAPRYKLDPSGCLRDAAWLPSDIGRVGWVAATHDTGSSSYGNC